MTFIEPVDDEEFAAQDRKALGYTPNYNRLFARRPGVYEAWKQLNGAIRSNMELRRYELATIAAAQQLRSSYCSLAHGKVLVEKFGVRPEDTLTDEEQAVQELARKVAADALSVTEADYGRLRAFGLGDDEIFDVVLAAAARSFFCKAIDGTGTQPDAEYRELLDADLREALTVGRPIAEP
jgi:alkylhydroperoxidase family enzyme